MELQTIFDSDCRSVIIEYQMK